MTRKLAAFAGVVGLLLVQGCSHPATGMPPSSVSTPSASSSAQVPVVQNPLPASVVSKHPCESALTSGQLTQLIGEVPSPRHTDNAAGPGCGWTKQSTSAVVDVGWLSGATGGIGQVYQAEQSAAYHEPLDIEGYPALAYNSTENPPVAGCNISFGISDTLVVDAGFTVGSDRYGKLNPCDAAKAIAQDVLDNLKAAAQ